VKACFGRSFASFGCSLIEFFLMEVTPDAKKSTDKDGADVRIVSYGDSHQEGPRLTRVEAVLIENKEDRHP
jgi:hypothetical protein